MHGETVKFGDKKFYWLVYSLNKMNFVKKGSFKPGP